MPETICLRGRIRKGDPCWRLDADEGPGVFLVGDLSKIRDGDSVIVCGTPAQAGFCGGEALAVSFIGTSIGGAEALPTVVMRDIDVTATLSTRDLSPTFRLEERDVSLHAAATQWRTRAAGVTVMGKLDVFFMSTGWIDQQFTLSVTATDPGDASKSWSKDFKATVKKDHVVINERMDVGAAEPPKEVVA